MDNNLQKHIAKHYRELHFGKNWTWSNMTEVLEDVTWEQANTKIYSLNTIAALVYHIGYYTTSALKVLKGGPLEGKDKFSFDHPLIESDQDWQELKERIFSEAKEFADLIEQLEVDKFWETFTDEKYGNYFRNIVGTIEHGHYHLGQILVIKKILIEQNKVLSS